MNTPLVPLGLTPEAKLERRRFIHRFEELQRKAAEYKLNVVVWRPTLRDEALVVHATGQLQHSVESVGDTAHLSFETAFERLPPLERAAYLVLLDDTDQSVAALRAVGTQSDLRMRMFVALPRPLLPQTPVESSADSPVLENGAILYWTYEYDEHELDVATLVAKVLRWLTVSRLALAWRDHQGDNTP